MAVEPGPAGSVRFFDPYCYRCDFGLTYPDCGIHCLKALERQIELENPSTVAAVVVEPVTGAAGGFPLPEGYLAGLRDLCDRHGILLIADEVITGFGRTGAWFGVNHDSVVPDIMVMAKGITSGYVPMGAVVVSPRISGHFETRMLPIGSTYAASPLATAAARACLVAYQEEGCVENARRHTPASPSRASRKAQIPRRWQPPNPAGRNHRPAATCRPRRTRRSARARPAASSPA